MGDGVANGPETSFIPQAESLQGKEGVTLYKSNEFEVFVPKNPNIPLTEGLHIQISDGHDSEDSPKEILARYTLALGAAKVLAESGMTRDAWANTRLEEGQTVSVYGRVPGEENSWRKPVDTLERNSPQVDKVDPRLAELFRRYMPKWEELSNRMELFKNGVNGKDINEVSRESVTVWESDSLKLEVILNPHLKGLHLIASPKESFQRQWQTVQGQDSEQVYIQQTLEATAVAMGGQKLLAEGRGEIHNSGNWASGLKVTQEGGKLDLEKLSENRKAEKKSHRPDIAEPESQMNTGMHVHVYIPSEGPVILPKMSKQEAIERGRLDVVKQWEEIPPMDQTQLEDIRVKLGEGKLTNWLEENCKGQLKSKMT